MKFTTLAVLPATAVGLLWMAADASRAGIETMGPLSGLLLLVLPTTCFVLAVYWTARIVRGAFR